MDHYKSDGVGEDGKKNHARGNVQKNSSKVKPTESKKSCKGQTCCFTLKPEWIPFAIITQYTRDIRVPASWPQESKARIRYVQSKFMVLHALIMHIYALEKKKRRKTSWVAIYTSIVSLWVATDHDLLTLYFKLMAFHKLHALRFWDLEWHET